MTGRLDVRSEVQLAAWTTIPTTGPGSVRNTAGISITTGRPNESALFTPSQASLILDNRDNRWTVRNPMGAYYPNLVQNTPLRISLPASAASLSNYLRFEGDTTSSVTTPDKAGLQITGPIDIRVDCWPSDYSGDVLAAKWGATAKSWAFVLNATASPAFVNFRDIVTPATGTLGFYWWDGSAQQMLDSGLPLPYFGQRICLRVLFTPSTGTAQFFTAPTMAGPFTQLGLNQVFGATTLSNGAGQAVQVGGSLTLNIPPGAYAHTFGSCLGMVYEAQVLNNVTLEVDPVFSSQTAGTTSFTDSQSSLWTLNGTAEISDRLYRFHGELSSLPRAADPSQHDVNDPATATGITQRLQNSNTPLQSPMRRAYARLPASLNLAAYWPGEDNAGATSIGSALGGPAMQIAGSPNLASNSNFVCSAPLAVMNGATFTANVPSGATFTDNVVRLLYESPVGGETNGTVIASFTCTGGGVGYVTLVYTTGANFTMNGYNTPGGTLLGSCSASLIPNGGQARISLVLRKNGTGGTDMSMESLVPNGLAFANGTSVAAISASPPGAVSRVQFLSGGVMGHFSVQGLWDTEYDTQGALCAWNGENAAARVMRLCTEEGISCRITGSQVASMPMGNQTIDTLMNLLQQCENTDLGMLFDPRQALGIGYRTRSSMYHQTPTCTVNFAGRQVSAGFAPATDTLLAVNDVTATSPTGSTARQIKTTGRMSIQAPPNGISRIDTQITPSPQADGELSQIASWYLSVRSVDDDRYTAIPLNMARAETPVTAALLNIGDYLQITGTPAWVPPPPVRQLVAGYTETLGPQPQWLIGVNGIPELPYETARAGAAAGTAGNAKADTAGSQLTAGISTAPASFQVTTTAGPVWVNSTAVRGNVSGLLNAVDGGTFTWAVNPAAGQKVLVGLFSTSTETVTLVKDNGTTPTTFTLDATQTSGGHTIWIYRADSITLPATGSYAVTVTTGLQGHTVSGGGVAYAGVKTGAPTAVNQATNGTGTAVTTGSVTPNGTGALFFGVFSDASAIAETITLTAAGFTQEFVAANGTSYSPGAVADKIDPAGPTATACTWTLGDSVAWVGAIAVYDAAIPVSLPFDIVIDGEQKTVSNITGTASPQTFIIGANSVNGVVLAHSAGAAVSLYRKPIAAL